jgi:hypothetical protein
VAPTIAHVLDKLRASRLADLAGARVTASIPLGERLLNDIVAASLPRSGVLREATIHPLDDNRLGVHVKVERPAFLPPITITLVIERQPDFPQSPRLVFRVIGLAGWLALATPLLPIDRMLPPGVRLESDLLTVDLAALLAQHGYAEWLRNVDRLVVKSERGRLLIDLEASVPP